jgi:adenylyltransferase/sulfurtransferase
MVATTDNSSAAAGGMRPARRPTAAQQTAPDTAAAPTEPIEPQALAEQLEAPDRPFLLDVREPFETEIASIPGTSKLIPLGELPNRLDELDPQEEMVVYCRSGNRSGQAVQILRRAGFSNVRNLEGGVIGWSEEVDPSMPTY